MNLNLSMNPSLNLSLGTFQCARKYWTLFKKGLWLILGEENDIYPFTATLSDNALEPPPPPQRQFDANRAVGGYGRLPFFLF